MKKTISYLNGKIWYRFIKVIYLLAFILFLIGPVIFIVLNFTPTINFDQSYLQCNNGYKVSSNYLKNDGIYNFDSLDYSSDLRIKARYFCILQDVEKEFGKEQIESNIKIAKLRASWAENDGDKTYKIVSIYQNRNLLGTIGYSFLSILITFFVFEFLRRIFYFIILGSIKPKK